MTEKAHNCPVREFCGISFVKANGCVGRVYRLYDTLNSDFVHAHITFIYTLHSNFLYTHNFIDSLPRKVIVMHFIKYDTTEIIDIKTTTYFLQCACMHTKLAVDMKCNIYPYVIGL